MILKKLKYLVNQNLFFIATLAFLFLNLILSLSSYINTTNLISFFLISTIGIYHGSFDIKKGYLIKDYFNLKSINIFLAFYISICLLSIYIWYISPLFAISIFLIISIYHFGYEELDFYYLDGNFLSSVIRGLNILILPLVFSTKETFIIFNYLNIELSDYYFNFLNNNYFLVIILVTINIAVTKYYFKKIKTNLNLFIDMVSMIVLNLIFDPLFAFCIYFCFLHSSRNLVKTYTTFTKSRRNFNKDVNIIALITFLTLIFIFFINLQNIDFSFSINTTIFIGLLSLTFPHFITDIFYNYTIHSCNE